LAGYEDLNDAERLAADPTFRLISSQRILGPRRALTSTLHRFETELLTKEDNLIGLMALNRETLGQAESFDSSDRIVLDMDSSESPVHGAQEGSAYNGHFESVCYHPLFLFKTRFSTVIARLLITDFVSTFKCQIVGRTPSAILELHETLGGWNYLPLRRMGASWSGARVPCLRTAW